MLLCKIYTHVDLQIVDFVPDTFICTTYAKTKITQFRSYL
jgi:hypothetical protein